jgi:hypothetical protein
VIADAVLMGRTLLIERGVSRPEAFRDTLRAPRVYDGVSGAVGFAENGEPVRELRFLNIVDGAFVGSPLTAETGRGGASDPIN